MSSRMGLYLIGLIFVVGYGTSFNWVVTHWLTKGGHYSHGFLVLGLFAYCLWKNWGVVTDRALDRTRQQAVFIAIVVSGLAWLVGVLAGIERIALIAAVFLLWIGLSSVAGRGAVLRLIPYMLLFISVLPVWGFFFTSTLQTIATHVVNAIFQFIGLTVYMEGNKIFMPAIIFEIVGGCSGLGYLLVALALSLTFTLVDKLRFKASVTLITVFLLLALISNWIRIFCIMLLGYVEGPNHPLITDHVWFGWVVLGVIFLPALWYLPTKLAAVFDDGDSTRNEQALVDQPSKAVVGMTVTTFSVAPLVLLLLAGVSLTKSPQPTWLSANLSIYEQTDAASFLWRPEFSAASLKRHEAYDLDADANPTNDVFMFQAFYPSQSNDVEVIDADNSVVGEHWRKTPDEIQTLELSKWISADTELGKVPDSIQQVKQVILRSDYLPERLLVWYWYDVGRLNTASERTAKLYQIAQSFEFRRDASIRVFATMCHAKDCNTARYRLGEFINQLSYRKETVQAL